MSSIDSLKISIVIPVYNEDSRLAACLEAIDNLSTKPYEVVVIDNNSTDHSLAVASNFPHVRLISETKQGVVHARNRGFNAARGNIIARIDADTLLPPDWLDHISRIFQDQSVAAVSGSANYYDFLLSGFANSIDHWARGYVSPHLKQRNFLHGANMALRRSAWLKTKRHSCQVGGLHEDMDLAIHLQEAGYKVVYDPSLVAGVSSRRLNNGFLDFVRYAMASPRTYAAHKLHCQKYMYPVIFISLALYLPGKLLYRTYDPLSGGFSLRSLFIASTNSVRRTDPTINVA